MLRLARPLARDEDEALIDDRAVPTEDLVSPSFQVDRVDDEQGVQLPVYLCEPSLAFREEEPRRLLK